jgi:hypothetical protein
VEVKEVGVHKTLVVQLDGTARAEEILDRQGECVGGVVAIGKEAIGKDILLLVGDRAVENTVDWEASDSSEEWQIFFADEDEPVVVEELVEQEDKKDPLGSSLAVEFTGRDAVDGDEKTGFDTNDRGKRPGNSQR